MSLPKELLRFVRAVSKKSIIAPIVLAMIGTAPAYEAKADVETLALQFLGQASGADWNALSDEATATIESLSEANSNFDAASLTDFACFEVDLVDPSSGIVVGVGVDCLSPNVQNSEDPEGAGAKVEAFSFFMLPGGAFVSNGLTSVRPFYAGVGDAGGAYTHVTGSVPDTDNIVGGIGQFKGTGTVRVSGVVNLSQMDSGTISFNCLWVVKVETVSSD